MKTLALHMSTAALTIVITTASVFATMPKPEKSTDIFTDQKLEQFMTDCSYWLLDSQPEEDTYRVEDWMIDTSNWKVLSTEELSDESTQVESWMIDPTLWIEELAAPETFETETWMFDPTFWYECCDEETEPESWMTATDFWKK